MEAQLCSNEDDVVTWQEYANSIHIVVNGQERLTGVGGRGKGELHWHLLLVSFLNI